MVTQIIDNNNKSYSSSSSEHAPIQWDHLHGSLFFTDFCPLPSLLRCGFIYPHHVLTALPLFLLPLTPLLDLFLPPPPPAFCLCAQTLSVCSHSAIPLSGVTIASGHTSLVPSWSFCRLWLYKSPSTSSTPSPSSWTAAFLFIAQYSELYNNTSLIAGW